LEVAGGGRVLLPGSKAPKDLSIGQELHVFIYVDNEGRPIATTQKPLACVNQFAVLEVKDVNDFGAFLDWGLDKDLMLPFKQQLGELQTGDKCVVYILEDERSGRIVATEKIRSFLDLDTSPLRVGQKVTIAVYEVTEEYVDFLVDYRYTGRLYTQDIESFHIGDIGDGFIQNIREDGKLAISLSPVGYDALLDSVGAVLQKLGEADGFLPYGDFSSPEEIKQEFGLSKKAFKKIIGTLFREKKIYITDRGIEKA
jgi:hypothetical protein